MGLRGRVPSRVQGRALPGSGAEPQPYFRRSVSSTRLLDRAAISVSE